jgi:flavin-dependent dehydrogenase
MKHYGIIGGGPAGLYLAYLLRQSGIECTVFDHQIPFEKPCGGGVTSKAFRQFPILSDLPSMARHLKNFHFISPNDRSAKVATDTELYIVSRTDLSRYMLEKCQSLGVNLCSEKVEKMAKLPDGSFQVKTSQNVYDFTFLVGADGANGISRRMLGAESFAKNRIGVLGYHIYGLDPNEVVIKFYENVPGYLYVFPRDGHSSVGFGALAGNFSKEFTDKAVREFVDKYYPGMRIEETGYYAATIPVVWKWKKEWVQGENFAFVGDAGGFADALTGEGIYYAFKSAEVLAKCLIEDRPEDYYQEAQPIIAELQKAANIFHRFYRNFILNAMVYFVKRSTFLQKIMSGLILGEQPYLTLKPTIKSKIPYIFSEVLKSYFWPEAVKNMR